MTKKELIKLLATTLINIPDDAEVVIGTQYANYIIQDVATLEYGGKTDRIVLLNRSIMNVSFPPAMSDTAYKDVLNRSSLKLINKTDK